LWAFARYEFGIRTWEEFAELTPGEFQELAKRRNIRIRYDRYANALTSAAVYNTNRTSEDSPVVTAFDFIRDEESARKLERIRAAKRDIKTVIGQLPMTTPRSVFLSKRLRVIADLQANGYANAEALFDAVWPSLKPTEEEERTGAEL
jgi:hypothetical protein